MDKTIRVIPPISYVNAIFILFFVLLLSSCSSHISRSDGPPNFYVDESKIPNAKPKPEPLAKYGNMRSYRVFGRRYYTMKSSKNYAATGVASWYGTKFHAQRTSSGEPYNMLAMTAAHKTLPLPTYVEVTNLSNQRKIIVKVNDRGPFSGNRLIDLSYVAAKKLGMMGRGTAKVAIRAINPYTSQPFEAPKKIKNIDHNHLDTPLFYLQVGAFRHKSGAEKLKQRLLTLTIILR